MSDNIQFIPKEDLEYKVVEGKPSSRLKRLVYGKDSFAVDVVALIRSVSD